MNRLEHPSFSRTASEPQIYRTFATPCPEKKMALGKNFKKSRKPYLFDRPRCLQGVFLNGTFLKATPAYRTSCASLQLENRGGRKRTGTTQPLCEKLHGALPSSTSIPSSRCHARLALRKRVTGTMIVAYMRTLEVGCIRNQHAGFLSDVGYTSRRLSCCAGHVCSRVPWGNKLHTTGVT